MGSHCPTKLVCSYCIKPCTLVVTNVFIPVEWDFPTPTKAWRGTTPSWRKTTQSWRGTTPSLRRTTPSWRRTTPSWRRTTPSWRQTTRHPLRSCGYWEFQCSNGECVNRSVLCDGAFNCGDGSDEAWFNCESEFVFIN